MKNPNGAFFARAVWIQTCLSFKTEGVKMEVENN